MIIGLVDEAFASKAGEQAADSLAGEACHATKIFLVELHRKGNGDMRMGGTGSGVVVVRPVEQGTGEFASGGGVESEATRGEDSAVVLARDGKSGDAADVGVGLHEADVVGAGNGFDGAGGEGFGANAVNGVFLKSGEAEDVTGTGDAEEEQAALAGGGGDFDAAGAQDREMIRGQAFVKKDCVRFATAADAERIEFARGVRRKRGQTLGTDDRTFGAAAWENGRPPGGSD